MIKKILFLGIFYFALFSAYAQKIEVKASINSKQIVIGKQAKITLQASVYAVQAIKFPIFQDSIVKGIEIVEIGEIDTAFSKANSTYLLSQEIIVTSFDSGNYIIPPFVFLANGRDSLLTNDLLLKVNTIVVDTTEKSVKDIYTVYDTPLTFKEFIKEYKYWLIGGFISIVAIVLLVLYFTRWRKKTSEIQTEKPKKAIPFHIIAIEKLEKLKLQKLWQSGNVKQYYTELTDILREYIENRYKISTTEQTSSETIDACMKITDIQPDRISELRLIFSYADLAKFAKSEPLPDENDLAFSKTLNFVQQTKETNLISENVKTINT